MKERNSILLTAILLMLSIGNFFRIKGNENIRAIQFVSIFVIGILTTLLINALVLKFKVKK